jgi:excisionase family DNA binding protein
MQAVTITQINPPELETLLENTLKRILASYGLKSQPLEDEMMSISETSTFLDLAVPTIYTKVHLKEIPFHKVGKKLRFSKTELLTWQKSKNSNHAKVN